jgi:hypothetical protein
MIMKKILFAFTLLTLAVSALPQARGDDISIDFIYDNLSGGNWIEVEGFGYGWQPDVAVSDPNWRPYADGYWAYTDYGWTWISYEDFGWATYHYGRWANLTDYGWVWFPGSDLDWGPAWVSWRTGGDYIGWAPLPPRGAGIIYDGQPIGGNVDITFDIGPEYYNFCDVRFIGEPVLRDRIFPPAQNVTYITNTVNVTNITVQNNIVYNYGPNYNVVNQYSSRPIQRLTIERQTAANLSTAVKSGALTKVQGNKLLLAAPQKIAKAPATVKPPAVKARVEQPKIQHGWKGVPNEAELKEKIRNQNPKNIPPPTRAAAREAESPAPALGARPAGVAAAAPTSPGARAKEGERGPGRSSSQNVVAQPNEPAQAGKEKRAGTKDLEADRDKSALERGKPQDKGGALSTSPRERGGLNDAENARPPAPSQGAGQIQPERGRPSAAQSGEEANAAQRGAGRISPQQSQRTLQRQRFGTPPPRSTTEHEQRGEGPPPALRQPAAPRVDGGPAGEARGRQERTQGVHSQPPQQRTGVPAAAEPGQAEGQPEGGRKRAPRETPPPGPR